MKLNLVTIFCILLGSIFAKNINKDFKAPLSQDRTKLDTITNLQGFKKSNKVNLFEYECRGIVKSSIITMTSWNFVEYSCALSRKSDISV